MLDTEQTFVMIKPDGIQRRLTGEIISRFEKKGLKISAMKMLVISREMAEQHYSEHKGKAFYESLIDFIISGPVIAFILEGPGAISIVRKLVGATDPANAEPGSIRGDHVIFTTYNIIHASDSANSSKSEISLFFKKEEIHNYYLEIEKYLFSS
ncbi:MAG: nucleoside-diphosphate kinase [Candidatus Aminicenantes bacterium]|nr:nucleoside-diphosphate kinase [Candidatus Aminicenantes bacterium]MCK5004450.1 nucleoside-diphosphate kinase [Candidatus Aminicenantes bacterium]